MKGLVSVVVAHNDSRVSGLTFETRHAHLCSAFLTSIFS